ncbi:MAG: putative major pilin subunit [Planctomycetes bacterium ADurb.Bin401]|nr:MAG: putative major pilin subunit [Planctomycetes bacterium ADurb.Bin401]
MERRKMKKKGFTLVELLVVIAIIAMLLAILMPALGKVRQLAQRIMCSTNLSGLGKAMLTYSNDDKYESFPIGGSSGAYWNRGTSGKAGNNSFEWNWTVFKENGTSNTTKYATLSSCLYLLVKIADTTPDQFICPGSDNKKFELNNFTPDNNYKTVSFSDVWDFGEQEDAVSSFNMGKGHNTYSYQLPLPLQNQTSNVYPISTTSNPARPVMADRNPFCQSPLPGSAGSAYLYNWDSGTNGKKIYQESLPQGNALYHQKEGQNVLYADMHAKFEKSANCGVQQDNIYTYWGRALIDDPQSEEQFRQCGKGATNTSSDKTAFDNPMTTTQATTDGSATIPLNEEDSYLVSDVDAY